MLRLVLGIGWLIVLLFAMLTPGDQFPEVDYFSLQDKLIHVICFAVLSFIWAGVREPIFRDSSKGRRLNFLIFGLLLGILLEAAQTQVPNRTFDLYDILANIIGGSLGILTFLNISKPK